MNSLRVDSTSGTVQLDNANSTVLYLSSAIASTIRQREWEIHKKAERRNNVMERTYLLEEKMKAANHRIEDLERKAE